MKSTLLGCDPRVRRTEPHDCHLGKWVKNDKGPWVQASHTSFILQVTERTKT